MTDYLRVSALRLGTCAFVVLGATSCSSSDVSPQQKTEKLKRKFERKDEKYYERIERRRLRKERQDKLYDAWWDSIMKE